MKKYIIIAGVIILSLVLAFFFQPEKETNSNDLMGNADYVENTVIGEGEKTIYLCVVTADKSITLTVKTDADFLADALCEYDLISGEEGPYGLYVKSVNGIVADYDVDESYWALTKDGEYVSKGVSEVPIADGENYEFTYTK